MNTKKKTGRIVRMAVLDILLAGVLLLTFAFFHHVLPALKMQAMKQQPQSLPEIVRPAPEAVPEQDISVPDIQLEVPDPAPQQSGEIPEEVPVEEPVVVIDNRTEWQKKFEEHFSDEIIWTENSYKSPNVSVEIETVTDDFGNGKVTYYVADIYVGSVENFTAQTANNRMLYFDNQDALEMHEAAGSIVSMTGDFMTYQKSGFLIRNGEYYDDAYTYCDICVMYPDGSIETYLKNEYDKQEIMDRNPIQAWNFGPALLDENGASKDTFNTSSTVAQINPRSALGYYEPGHYCFVVVDGRSEGHSVGMYLDELSDVFESLGCTAAYNMDGGGSALMMFGDSHFSQMSNGGDRDLGDIILVRETEASE